MPKRKFEDWSGPARKRLYRALPLIGAGMVVFGLVNESKSAIIVGILGALIGPVQGEVAARHVPDDEDLETPSALAKVRRGHTGERAGRAHIRGEAPGPRSVIEARR